MYLAVVTQRALKVSLVKPGDRNLIKPVSFSVKVCLQSAYKVDSQNDQPLLVHKV